MSNLTVDNLEDYFDSAVEIFNLADKSSIGIDIDLNALPKGCEHIRIFLNSKDGSLKNCSVVSQIEAGYEPDDFEEDDDPGKIISVKIGTPIRNPNAAQEIADCYAKMKRTNSKSKS